MLHQPIPQPDRTAPPEESAAIAYLRERMPSEECISRLLRENPGKTRAQVIALQQARYVDRRQRFERGETRGADANPRVRPLDLTAEQRRASGLGL